MKGIHVTTLPLPANSLLCKEAQGGEARRLVAPRLTLLIAKLNLCFKLTRRNASLHRQNWGFFGLIGSTLWVRINMRD
jgi:hypothetical protein